MPRRISDEQIDELRDLAAAGTPTRELADRFGITPRHARRLVKDVPPLRLQVHDGRIVQAVERLIAELELDAADLVIAVSAVTVARNLELASGRDTPALARQLVELVDALRDDPHGKPDFVDDLRRRAETKRLELAAAAASDSDSES